MPDTVVDDRPAIDPYPLSPYVAWAGNRNRDPILSVFEGLFPTTGNVLELASGSGMHINYFAPRFPQLQFQPSDYNADVFETIKAKRAEQGITNVADPVSIDLTNSRAGPIPRTGSMTSFSSSISSRWRLSRSSMESRKCRPGF